MTLRFKSSKQHLTASEVGALRGACDLSIAEIRSRAATDVFLLEIPVFSGEWPKSKPRLLSLLAAIENGSLPMRVLMVDESSDSSGCEEELTVLQAREQLSRFREIALQQDMHQQLSLGHIKSEEEYVPPPELDS